MHEDLSLKANNGRRENGRPADSPNLPLISPAGIDLSAIIADIEKNLF